MRQGIHNISNQNLVIRSFLENGFWGTLSSKANVWNLWKGHFSVFSTFLSDEVETSFWESETKRSKLFQSKFGNKKLVREWFSRYLKLKNEYCEHLKRAFFSFLQIVEWLRWSHFLGKRDNVAKTFSIKSLFLRAF